MKNSKLSLIVKTRERILFQGDIKALTSFNQLGTFDVLPEHANFISLIEKSLVIHDLRGTKQEIKFDIAILRVVEDKVEVYLGIKNLSQAL